MKRLENLRNKVKGMTFITLVMIIFIITPLGFSSASSQNIVKPLEVETIEDLCCCEDCKCILVATASWCGPCRAELPTLMKLYDKYKDEGVKIIGISIDESGPSAMQPIVDQLGVNFPVYWGDKKFMEEYNVGGIPLLIFIKEGKELERIIGKRSEKYLEKKIIKLFK